MEKMFAYQEQGKLKKNLATRLELATLWTRLV